MLRPALFVLSLITASAPALAGAPAYRASLENPAPQRLIVKDLIWSCTGGSCAAPRTATAPDANVCASIARKLGRLVSFQAGDRAFQADELQRCNAAAQ